MSVHINILSVSWCDSSVAHFELCSVILGGSQSTPHWFPAPQFGLRLEEDLGDFVGYLDSTDELQTAAKSRHTEHSWLVKQR